MVLRASSDREGRGEWPWTSLCVASDGALTRCRRVSLATSAMSAPLEISFPALSDACRFIVQSDILGVAGSEWQVPIAAAMGEGAQGNACDMLRRREEAVVLGNSHRPCRLPVYTAVVRGWLPLLPGGPHGPSAQFRAGIRIQELFLSYVL